MRRSPLAKGHWAFTLLALYSLASLQLGFSYVEGCETSPPYLEFSCEFSGFESSTVSFLTPTP